MIALRPAVAPFNDSRPIQERVVEAKANAAHARNRDAEERARREALPLGGQRIGWRNIHLGVVDIGMFHANNLRRLG